MIEDIQMDIVKTEQEQAAVKGIRSPRKKEEKTTTLIIASD